MSSQEPHGAFRARLDGAAISTFALATLSVPAKIWCRTRTTGWRSLGWDDLLAVVTLVWANAFFWTTMISMRGYLGKNAGTEVPLQDVALFLKWLYGVSLVYVVAISFIKFTILSFYWKLFSVRARVPIVAIATSVVIWMVVFLCLGSFGCRPIKAQWDITMNPSEVKCLPKKAIYLGGSLPNVIVDLIIVVMPMPYVWKLHAPLGQRLIFISMFVLGFFICIVSIIRLTEVMSISTADQNVTYNLKDFMLWSIVEINIGLLCACLPSMRRMLSLIGLGRLFSKGSSAESKGHPCRFTPNTVIGGNSHQPAGDGNKGSKARGSKRKQSRSLFTAGLAKINSEEDAYQMIGHISNPKGERSNAGVEHLDRTSGEWENLSTRNDALNGGNPIGIIVRRDYRVEVDSPKRSSF